MKIVFFGSDDFACVCLEGLVRAGEEVVACVTQPDRAKGRGLKISASPVKVCAGKNKLPVLQPADLKTPALIKQLEAFEADLFVVIAYGKFLPGELLKIPKTCAINVHASLLPKYRGAAPINWAIINGEKETGLSVIKLNAKMDAGDIVLQKKNKIQADDTAVTLRARMADLGANLLCEAIALLKKGKTSFQKQDSTKVTFAPKLKKEHGLFSWEKGAEEIHNLVRGLLPWPSAYTSINGKLLKILETEVRKPEQKENQPGVIYEINDQGILVGTGKDFLLVKKVHLESAKAMSAKSFVSGHKIGKGMKLGK